MAVDAEIFQGCRRGEPFAWRQLYRAYAAKVYRWAVLRGLRPAQAEDAAQEVLAVAHRRFDTCRAPEAFESWLYQITRKIVANQRRRAWWRRVFPVAETPERAFDGRGTETELAVRACLAQLPDAQAEVVFLSDVEGYTRVEIAEMIGIANGTVASRLRLGRAAFRAIWAEQAPAQCGAPVEET
jgi:RNA polymerase sigma-70 factor (ECF subfamily)